MRLFISYAHVDRATIEDWIVEKLRSGGHDVWFDDGLVPGQDWKNQLDAEIQLSDIVVFAMTPESVTSEWCLWEVGRAVELGKPIIPVLVQEKTKLPPQLGNLQYVDFSKGATANAVARLMGGIQKLSPSQIPNVPANPKGIPAQAISLTNEKTLQRNSMLKLLRDPAVQALIGIIGVVIAILAFMSTNGGNPTTTVTQTSVSLPPTPATPVVWALRDLEIRLGPGSNFPRLNILPSSSSLDILGISEDRVWYQVLLSDGTSGWVLAASSGAELRGNRDVMHVVIPTLTPSPIPSNTPTLTYTPQSTSTATNTIEPTITPIQAAIKTSTQILVVPTLTVFSNVSSDIPKFLPCQAKIISNTDATRVGVRYQPNGDFTNVYLDVDQIVIIKELKLINGDTWFRIAALESRGSTLGWLGKDNISLSSSCF